MPSVNPIQAAEPRVQSANKQQAPSGDPFADVLESATNKRRASDEPRAERSARRDQPEAPAARSKRRADALDHGEQPKGEVHRAPRSQDKPVDQVAKTDAAPADDAAKPADNSQPAANDQQKQNAVDTPDTPGVTAVQPQSDPAMPADQSVGQSPVADVNAEALPAPAENAVAPAAAEAEAAPITQPVAEAAEPTVPSTDALPEMAQADEAPAEVPVAAAQKAAAAPQTAPATDEAEGAEAAPPAAINGRLAASGTQAQSQGNSPVEQNKAPAADPVTVKTDDAEQPAPQQSNAAQNQAKPQDSAAARPQESNAPAPAAADSAAPKAQANSTNTPPVPEPVRVMSASLEPGRFTLTNGSEVKPTPINMPAVAVEIVSRMRDGLKRFDIRLDPPELGRVDVRLEVDRNGNVSTKLTVERPETLDLMQRDARALERALQQAGLKTDAGGLEFSLRQHADERFAQGQGNPGHGDMQSERVIAETGEPAEAVVQGYYRASAFARGGVDITV